MEFTVADNNQQVQICNLTCRLWNQVLKQYNFKLKFAKVLPYLYPYLSGSHILNCRLVSKKWLTAVKLCNPKVEPKIKLNINRHEKQILHNIAYYFPGHFVRHFQFQRDDIFDDIPEHDMLLPQRIRNLQDVRSSFIFNSLSLLVSHNRTNWSDFMDDLPQLNETRALELHFSIRLKERNDYFILINILLKVPSLEYLKLTTANQTEEMLPKVFPNVRFPLLPKLKTLNVQQLPRIFAEYLISHYKSTLLANNQQEFDICHVLYRKENLFWWKGPIKILKAQMGERSLTHTHFSIASENYTPCKIGEEIQNYRNTLKVLSIKWLGLKQLRAHISEELELNGINVNWTSGDSLESSFEFLKDLRNLEQLKIQLRIADYKNLIQTKKNIPSSLCIIDFENNLEEIEDLMDDDIVIRKMYKSNIWSLMSKLKRVCISIVNDEQIEEEGQMKRVYTRRELNELYPQICIDFYASE